jgi:hypothetical protein
MAGRLTRFLKLERRHAPAPGPAAEVATRSRFSGEPSGIALEPDFGEQPFLRCPGCEADNTRFSERCINCQASLTGEDVRAWNAELWARRQAEQRAPPAADAQRALGEAIAQEVAERERARLSGWEERGSNRTPLGLQLLALLPTPRARVVAGTAMAAVFLGSIATAIAAAGHPLLRAGAFGVAMLLLGFFTPNVSRRSRLSRWD